MVHAIKTAEFEGHKHGKTLNFDMYPAASTVSILYTLVTTGILLCLHSGEGIRVQVAGSSSVFFVAQRRRVYSLARNSTQGETIVLHLFGGIWHPQLKARLDWGSGMHARASPSRKKTLEGSCVVSSGALNHTTLSIANWSRGLP